MCLVLLFQHVYTVACYSVIVYQLPFYQKITKPVSPILPFSIYLA